MEQVISLPQRRGRPARPSLSVGIADSAEVVRAAQELRYRVFVDEMGANLPILLPMARLSDRYARHFLGEPGGSVASVMNG